MATKKSPRPSKEAAARAKAESRDANRYFHNLAKQQAASKRKGK